MKKQGIPDYFDWERYGISPADIVRKTLGCEPESIRPLVVLAPVWMPGSLGIADGRVKRIAAGIMKVDDIDDGAFTFVICGMGAPLAGDATLVLGCTPCTHILFVGSVGGLDEREFIGDLATPTFSVTGDGFSAYLDASTAGPTTGPTAPSDRAAHPDEAFQSLVTDCARDECSAASVGFHSGPIYSTDTILAQFHHLDWMTRQLGCIGIEMETSAVFRASRLVGIKAAALLQFSDVIPSRKSLFSGRTAEEQRRRKELRGTVFSRAMQRALRSLA